MESPELKEAIAAFENAGEGLAPGHFEDLLPYLKAFHTTATVTLAKQPDEAKALDDWYALYLTASETWRATAMESYRRLMFEPAQSGNPGSMAGQLYESLPNSARRLECLLHMMMVSRISAACEVLRRHSDVDEPSRFLCWAGADHPELVIPPARQLCNWDSAARYHREQLRIMAEVLRKDGFGVIDIHGALHALQFEADAAWLQKLAGTGSASGEQVSTLYERCLEFLRPPVRSSWPLREFTECSSHDSMAEILNGLISHPLRLATSGDGLSLGNVLRHWPGNALKPLVVKSETANRNFVVFVTNTDFVLKEYPTEKDIADYELHPGVFLKSRIGDIRSSQFARLIQVRLGRARSDERTHAFIRKVGEHGVHISSAFAAGYFVRTMGLPDSVKDVLQPIIEELLKVI